MTRIYADHAATSPPLAEAVEAMLPFLNERFGNASSVHARGEAAREAVEVARARVASLLAAEPDEIVFTASGSEANNLAMRGALALAPEGRRRLVVSAIEHPSVMETARALEAAGYELTIVPVEPSGVVDAERVGAALGDDVALVSVQWVNNEVGTIQPVAAVAALARACGARVHADAVQAAGKLALAPAAAGLDLVSIAGHKFGGPPGAAALWVRRRVRIAPLVTGGHQERSRRAGTENVPAIAGFGVAAEHAREALAAGEPGRLAALGARLREGLARRIPDTRFHGDPARSVGSIVNVSFPGVEGEAVLHELDREGIAVSTGSACSSAAAGPSPVLLAMGLGADEAHASVRFSLGRGIGEPEVDAILDITPSVVARLGALGRPILKAGA